MSILILVVFLTLSISGMCSLFEAVLYSTRIGTLEAVKSKDRKKKLAVKFLKMKKEIAIPIASILILNTIANTAGATVAGMYAAKVLGNALVPLFSLLLTFGILFFSEILPKTYGAVRWRNLWHLIVLPLSLMKMSLRPLIYITQKFSRLVTRGQKLMTITEEEILAAVRIGAKEGEISDLEDLIETLLGTEIVDEKDQIVDMQESARKVKISGD